jgi:hypothetical protein
MRCPNRQPTPTTPSWVVLITNPIQPINFFSDLNPAG